MASGIDLSMLPEGTTATKYVECARMVVALKDGDEATHDEIKAALLIPKTALHREIQGGPQPAEFVQSMHAS